MNPATHARVTYGLLGVLVLLLGIYLGKYVLFPSEDARSETEAVAEEPAAVIRFLSPSENEEWKTGETREIVWEGGGKTVGLFLIDQSLESEGASVSVSDRVDAMPNEGRYTYAVPTDFKEGTYKWCLSSETNETSVCGLFFFIRASESQTRETIDGCDETFEGFPVTDVFEGEPKAVDWDTYPEARQFRTMIARDAKKGPNFAGHYTVAEWGCGTGCQNHAIVDARDGRIAAFGLLSAYGVKERLDSSLLVVNPPENLPPPEDLPEGLVTQYYALSAYELNLVCAE
ncbi:hypothetical protein HY734_01165 [Candidatus Uhrbacteria bacterium]|nr:hypothetical protein [Candidatus Uhrbacteria bacterium]